MTQQHVKHIIEITLESHGPVFVAGSFSEPAWRPVEMRPEHSGDSGTTFRAEILVTPGKSYQYKFKSGGGNVWFLDKTAMTAKDENGTENNLLVIPGAFVASEAGRKSSTTSQSAVPLLDLDLEEELDDEPLRTPLLAHESFGAFAVSKTEQEGLERYEPRQAVHSKLVNYALEDFDPGDPNLEEFPSDRSSVMATLQKIQSRQSEDSAGEVLMPSHHRPRRGSSDSTTDSLGHFSPIPLSPTGTRNREHRLSHGALAKPVPAGSLGSITEEEGEPGSKHMSASRKGPE